MQHGEFWYGMAGADGDPYGYARLAIADAPAGVSCNWELRLAFPGGTYEEERSAVHDAARRTLAATWAADGRRLAVERQGTRLVGTRVAADAETAIDVEVEDDALAGMGFVIAADLPFEAGATHAFHDYNEAQGLTPEGEARFTVAGPASLEVDGVTLETWKVLLHRSDGREMPLWIDGDRRIVRVDWGGGNLMTIAPAPTRHLFRPGDGASSG